MSNEKNHWFIKLDKDIFTKIKSSSSNVTAAFSLYLMLLFMMNYENRVLTSPNILLQQTGKGSRQMELLKKNINALCESGLISKISTNSDQSTSCQLGKIKYNDTLEIYLMEQPKNNYITIRLVNETIYRMLSKRKLDNAIAVYCYIKSFEMYNKTAVISQQKIANDLGIVENTVRAAINEIKHKGLLYTSGGNYNPYKKIKECKRYKTFDADNLLDTKELSTWKDKLKKKELTVLEIDADPGILSIIQEDEINNNIKLLLSNESYCPALLIGQYALAFRKMLTGSTGPIFDSHGLIPQFYGSFDNYIHNHKDLVAYIDRTADKGYVDDMDDMGDMHYGGYLFLFIEKPLNKNTQSLLIRAIDKELKYRSLILISRYDNIIFPLESRMLSIFKEPIKKVDQFKSLKLHDSYKNLARYEKTNPSFKRGGDARKHYLSEKSPKAYLLENMTAARDSRLQRTDMVLSKLTKGKTYLELL